MVPIPVIFRQPMLYILPHIQLGPSDDVYANGICGWIFFTQPCGYGCRRMGCMGTCGIDISRALLGTVKHGVKVQGMHG